MATKTKAKTRTDEIDISDHRRRRTETRESKIVAEQPTGSGFSELPDFLTWVKSRGIRHRRRIDAAYRWLDAETDWTKQVERVYLQCTYITERTRDHGSVTCYAVHFRPEETIRHYHETGELPPQSSEWIPENLKLIEPDTYLKTHFYIIENGRVRGIDKASFFELSRKDILDQFSRPVLRVEAESLQKAIEESKGPRRQISQ